MKECEKKKILCKIEYISKGERVTLIKSTLTSVPLYQMSLVRMPKAVVVRLDKTLSV